MKPHELLARLDSDEPLAPIYYLHGPETYFMDRALRKVIERAFPPGTCRELNHHVLAGKEINGEAVVREARTAPMLAKLRVIVARQCHQANASELDALAGYVRSPCESTCLLLLASSRVSTSSKLGRALSRRRGCSVDCRHPYERHLPPLIRTMAGERKIRLSHDTERYLIEVVGADLQALDDAVERLRLYTGAEARVDLDTAMRCIADTRVHQIWDLTNAIGEKRPEKALRVLARLRSDGLQALRAVPMLARTIRQLWTARALGRERLQPDAVAKALGLPPFIARNVASQARRFSQRDLARGLRLLHRAEITLKSSDIPATVREWVVLEELVGSMARASS